MSAASTAADRSATAEMPADVACDTIERTGAGAGAPSRMPGRCAMTLSKDERDALATIEQSLELDDPRLARNMRRMAVGPLADPIDSVWWTVAAIMVGLCVVALGASLRVPALAVPGLTIAIGVPVLITAVLVRRARRRR